MVFNFQSPYCFAIGRRGVLSLGGWTPHLQPGFHEPGPTLWAVGRYRTFTFSGRAFQPVRYWPSAFARRYLRSRGCFPFLRVLRCFSSPRSPRPPMHSAAGTPKGGFPHSEILRSQLGYQLPQAYRRFQRPSSPLDAKSSPVRPYQHDHTCPTPCPTPTHQEPVRPRNQTRQSPTAQSRIMRLRRVHCG